MQTIASKKFAAKGSDRASACRGNTPSTTPASRIRSIFSDALNHRSVAQTCTPNSRLRKIDDDARPQPRSKTRMPGRRSNTDVSHSVSQSTLAPPLALARTHSGLYWEDRGKRSERSRVSSLLKSPPPLPCQLANRGHHEIRCITRGDISEFRVALIRASVCAIRDASNDDGRDAETHANLSNRCTFHFDSDGIELPTQVGAVRRTGDERVAGHDQSLANPRALHAFRCPASCSQQIRSGREELGIDLAGCIVPRCRSDQTVGGHTAVVLISHACTNHNITRIQFDVDGSGRSGKNHSCWGKMIQQKRCCHRRADFADAGSSGNDAHVVDSAGGENDPLDPADLRACKPRLERCDLRRDSNNGKETSFSLLAGRMSTGSDSDNNENRNSCMAEKSCAQGPRIIVRTQIRLQKNSATGTLMDRGESYRATPSLASLAPPPHEYLQPILSVGPMTVRKKENRKQRTYGPSSLKGGRLDAAT